jgi:hypothetical protein
MSIDVRRARSFDRSSPVHAYWLANGEGFSVRAGEREGVVEEVELDLAHERAAALVVRYGPRRRSRLAPESVAAVVPSEELLLVPAAEAPPARIAPLAHRARERAAASARAGARASGDVVSGLGRTTGRAAAVAWLATRREAGRTAGTLGPATRRGARASRRGIVLAAAAVERETRGIASAVWRGLRRLRLWLAPRVAAGARAAATATAAWASAGAAAVVRAVRVHGPPARRAVERHASALAERLRSRPSGPPRDAQEQAPPPEPEPGGDDDRAGRRR